MAEPQAPRRPIMRLSKRFSCVQWLGISILVAGICLTLYSFLVACDDDIPHCDSSMSWQMFDVGIFCMLLFCCVPHFSLSDPEQFYDAFPSLKGKLNAQRFVDRYGNQPASTQPRPAPNTDQMV
eukprot:TRINITY_DN5248_c0_g1_i1.p2 TRINITY_DN5248_c0_g1~~TRINITY_DN5248_c0_g1_i1.p2  ORF type:complete len:124 (+),score=11.67 TRINITY_DN5248_c0_g1_i1:1453-1824(+)